MTTKIDAWESTMSRAETYALMEAADIEFENGNEDEGYAILEKIPVMPEIAMCLANAAGFGPGALEKSGLNLKDAEAKYGPDWLQRIER